MSGSDPAIEPAGRVSFDASHPENDPSHPRYEPPHLRHQPGDTWQIGGKPHDPDDSGPYGNPLWRPDSRTGRHRRGELPDPLPPETEPESSPPPVDRPSPGPRRSGFWNEPHQDRQHPQEGHRFDRLREDAWGAFMTDSAPLAAAHHTRPVRRSGQTALDREAGLALVMWIRLARWLFALIRSLNTRPEPKPGPEPEAGAEPNPGPHQTPAAGKRLRRLARQRTVEGPTCMAAPAPGSVPSGRAAFPQPGVPYGPDRGESTRSAVRATAQAGPARATAMTQGGPARATAMARAIAGAQRARAGVPAWV
ncbi:hypothetical protein [Glycomyces salinus]|uniref:hypothetical protein n=1 Tax=Glycomyces salinus TaxID=980294 RepID=UPI0018EE0C0E|nr:hypothetical protein [Glycomyces salinus]